MSDDEKLDLVRRLMDNALRDMERRAEEAVAAFHRLSPEEQVTNQLRGWEMLLGESHE